MFLVLLFSYGDNSGRVPFHLRGKGGNGGQSTARDKTTKEGGWGLEEGLERGNQGSGLLRDRMPFVPPSP